ncbi:MAG TPA: hypothetical protein VF331_11730 [Polyangiales bacterium]
MLRACACTLARVVELETVEPALRGEMTISFALVDADGSSALLCVHDRLPRSLWTANSQTGWQRSCMKLTKLIETR